MPTQHCECGAKYRFSDASLGKRAKCKECGTVFSLVGDEELGPIPFADEGVTSPEVATPNTAPAHGPAEAPVCPGCRITLPVGAKICVDCGIDLATGREIATSQEKSHEYASDRPRTYAQDILATFMFPTSLRNAITFGVLCVVILLLDFLTGSVGFWVFALLVLVCRLAFLGWWASYRFNVVAAGAAGDLDLPDLMVANDGLGALVMVFFRWLGSWILVLLPAAVFFGVAASQGWLDLNALDAALDNGVAGFLFFGSGPAEIAFGLLVVLGLFVWPIVILCVALGGFGCLGRVDLITYTMVRTFPVYLFTAAMVFGTDLLKFVLSSYVVDGLSGGGEEQGSAAWTGMTVLISCLVMGVGVYFELVAMRLIGLYYHHFKDRFAWSWG